jgi:hypothetical protein
LESSPAKKLFRSLGDEIEAVDVDGQQAWALASTLEPMRKLKAQTAQQRQASHETDLLQITRRIAPMVREAS